MIVKIENQWINPEDVVSIYVTGNTECSVVMKLRNGISLPTEGKYTKERAVSIMDEYAALINNSTQSYPV